MADSMDHIERQRDLLEKAGFVIPGNVYKMHYTILGFGHPMKPNHFAVNGTEKLKNLQTVDVFPLSTSPNRRKSLVNLNLSKQSNLLPIDNENLDRESFVFISFMKQIKIEKLFEEPTSHLRGSLIEAKREEVLNERKKYLKNQFFKEKKGVSHE
jgi:hypothetical protein